MLAGEMEVDGDLNVSGDIQSPTIAQLQEIIEQLQAQINSMQNADNKLETRFYELPRIEFSNGYQNEIDISSITGHELDYGILKIVNVKDFYLNSGDYQTIYLFNTVINQNGNISAAEHSIQIYSNGNVNLNYGGGGKSLSFKSGQYNFMEIGGSGASGWVDLVLAVTAQFPSESNVQSKDKEKVK